MAIFDPDAERAVLGAMLLHGDTAVPRRLVGELRAEHFYLEKHARIFEAIASLVEERAALDPLTVAQRLSRMEVQDISRADVDALPGDAPAAGHWDDYAQIVRDLASRRELRRVGLQLAEDAERSAAGEVRSRALEGLASVPERRQTDLFVPAAELRSVLPETPEAIWEGYVYRRAVTLLAGRPKVGKSTLAKGLVRAILAGERFLGLRTDATTVIYASEESAGTLLPDLPDSDRLLVLTRERAFPKPSFEVIVSAAVRAAQNSRALLVLDAASFWWNLADENDAVAAQRVMQPLLEAAQGGLGVLAVTHQRKAGGEGGEAIRGSSALAGTADVLVEVERAGDDAPLTARRVVAIGRFTATPPVRVVNFETTDRLWTVLGDATSRSDSAEVAWRHRLLAVLPHGEPGMANVELEEALGAHKRAWLGALKALCDGGEVACCGVGRRGDPYRYHRPESFREQFPSPAVHGKHGKPSPDVSVSVPPDSRRGRGRNRNGARSDSIPVSVPHTNDDDLLTGFVEQLDAVELPDAEHERYDWEAPAAAISWGTLRPAEAR